jgi:hypothetical protein
MSKQRYEQAGVAMTCRSFKEYERMFNLTEAELKAGPILDVAAGGSSFTAEACRLGYRATAVDPRYGAETEAWIAEATAEIDTSTAKLTQLQGELDWSYYGSPEQHKAGRIRSIQLFAEDVKAAGHTTRYAAGRLPALDFADHAFSLVLCSHFLFLYAEQFGAEFHQQAVFELMRICKPGGQVRIYPLLTLGWEPYPFLDELIRAIEALGARAELVRSSLPFIPGSDKMLRISL